RRCSGCCDSAGSSRVSTPARVTSSVSDRAYSRAALVSCEPGVTSCLSRAIWLSGVVVVSPQPGQANPGQTTHDDGAVWVSPALALNERILAAPPTSYHRLVAAPAVTSPCWPGRMHRQRWLAIAGQG